MLLIASLVVSVGILGISSLNYPGGHAISRLHKLESNSPKFAHNYVHIDNLAAISGVSRFTQVGEDYNVQQANEENRWSYSKQEGKVDFSHFTHLLAPNDTAVGFETIYVEHGFDGVSLSSFLHPIKISPKIYVMRRKAGSNDE